MEDTRYPRPHKGATDDVGARANTKARRLADRELRIRWDERVARRLAVQLDGLTTPELTTALRARGFRLSPRQAQSMGSLFTHGPWVKRGDTRPTGSNRSTSPVWVLAGQSGPGGEFSTHCHSCGQATKPGPPPPKRKRKRSQRVKS